MMKYFWPADTDKSGGSVFLFLFFFPSFRKLCLHDPSYSLLRHQTILSHLLNLSLPVPTRILSGVHSSCSGCHLRFVRSKGNHTGGVAGELGTERYLLPGLSSISSVKENRRTTQDPTLTVLEAHLLEPVGYLFLSIHTEESPLIPGLPPVVRLREGTLRPYKIPMVRRIEVDVKQGVIEGNRDYPPFRGTRGTEDAGGGGGWIQGESQT